MKYLKIIGAVIGSILIFRIVGFIINKFTIEILKINTLANLNSSSLYVRNLGEK
ncbi:MAG: hypothetical protein ACRDDL_05505 [Sarcina sp.]